MTTEREPSPAAAGITAEAHLAALERLLAWLETRPAGIHPSTVVQYTEARATVEQARAS